MLLKKYFSLILIILGFIGAQTTWAFSTKGGNILDNNGNVVTLDGVAWIGFQDSNFLGGLWNVAFNPIGSQNGVIQLLTTPWLVPGSNVTSADKGVAFKSIRLAMQPGIWHNANTIQQQPFAFQPTNISTPTAGNGPFCDWTKGADASGHCIQSKSAPDLLTAAINEFNKQSILVMLDFHHRPGLGDGFRDGTVVASDYSLQTYHDDIANFAKTAATNVVGIDIFNEPHQLFWFQDNTQTSPTQPAWIKVIAAAAAAVYDNNRNILLFVEGPGGTEGNDPYDPVYSLTNPICLPASTKADDPNALGLANDPAHCPSTSNPMRVVNIGVNWGENFRSLLDASQTGNGVAKFDTAKFRTMLIQAITTNNFSNTDPALIADWLLGPNNDGNNGHIVFAPHLYGSQVAGWQSDANDSQIRFKWNFGFVLDAGFPFVIGELGYDIQLPGTGGEDFFLNSVAPYLISKQINHNLFFWTWNHDDYPVGVRGNDGDLTLFAWKEQDLHNLFSAFLPPPQTGTLCVTVPQPTGYTGTTLPTITASGNSSYVFNLSSFDKLTCLNNVSVGNYSLTGTTLSNANGINFVPQQAYSASVSQNTETDVTVKYVQAPSGTLSVNVTGGTGCTISANQIFTVTYTSGSLNQQIQVTGTTPASATLPVGSYSISVTPNSLPSNSQCLAQFNKSINITASTTTQETINYVAAPPSQCSVNAQCTTWGTPQDPWSGSSCNFFIHSQTALTKPTTFTMTSIGITSLQYVWNATGTIINGNIVLQLTDPVNTTNVGFNASGVITLPNQASITSNGQTSNCPIIKSFIRL